MDTAFCTEDGGVYTTTDFARLASDEFERKRRLLQCPECRRPAFFRNASFIGRASCFGARPHADGCKLAAYDFVRTQYGAGEERDTEHVPRSRIVVDFNFGTFAPADPFQVIENTPGAQRVVRYSGDGYRTDVLVYRRPSSLLRNLIESPTFSNSDQIIDIPGHGEIVARDIFVPLQEASSRHSGLFRGFWGLLSDVGLAADHSIWFNSAGDDNISFVLDSKYLRDFNQRYRVESAEDLAGAFILVFGMPRVSQRGKLFCVIEELDLMALRLT